MHRVSASFHADALLQASSLLSCDALFGLTFHVMTPRRDRLRGIYNRVLFLIHDLCGRD